MLRQASIASFSPKQRGGDHTYIHMPGTNE